MQEPTKTQANGDFSSSRAGRSERDSSFRGGLGGGGGGGGDSKGAGFPRAFSSSSLASSGVRREVDWERVGGDDVNKDKGGRGGLASLSIKKPKR